MFSTISEIIQISFAFGFSFRNNGSTTSHLSMGARVALRHHISAWVPGWLYDITSQHGCQGGSMLYRKHILNS